MTDRKIDGWQIGHTPADPIYPPYFNITEISDKHVTITVRAPADADGRCGLTATMEMSKEDLRALCFQIEMQLKSDYHRAASRGFTVPWPRRSRIETMTPAELAILNATMAVERTGADPRLTNAVVLLDQARNKVADFVDDVTG